MRSIGLFCGVLAFGATMLVVPLWAQELESSRTLAADATASSNLPDAPLPEAAREAMAENAGQAAQETIAQTQSSPNQSAPSQSSPNQAAQQAGDGKSSPPDAAHTPVVVGATPSNPSEFGKQPKRILGIIPNYRAVSANAHLAPLDFKGEMWLATQDTFDYSNFLFVGVLAGINQGTKAQPAFGQGAEGFGKYYWHDFVDGAIENYLTEAIIPAATKEDPRYYTLAKGGFVKRTGYAVSRLFITRTNSGGSTFNLAEIVGSGAAAGLGNTYYPTEHNPFVKTYQRWGTQVGLDGIFNALKEFWPDIDRKIFRGKY